MQQTADTAARTARRMNVGRVPQRSSITMESIATKDSAVCIFHLLRGFEPARQCIQSNFLYFAVQNDCVIHTAIYIYPVEFPMQ